MIRLRNKINMFFVTHSYLKACNVYIVVFCVHYVDDLFCRNRYVAFVRYAAYHFQILQRKNISEKGVNVQESKLKEIKDCKTIVPGETEKKEDKETTEMETDEAKKIVEALTGTDNQTCESLHAF